MSRLSLRTAPAVIAAVFGLFLHLPGRATGSVEISFADAPHYSDAGRGALERERTLNALADHLSRWAERLPDGQSLKLTVLDIDLAGELEHVPRWHEVRVLRGRADWPKITLRFSLQQQGRTVSEGLARLSDMAYELGRRNPDEFGHEKRMLDRWFATTILSP